MSEKSLFDHITRDDVNKAIDRVIEKDMRQAGDLLRMIWRTTILPILPNILCPWRDFLPNKYFIPHTEFQGGEDSACFARPGILGLQFYQKQKRKN